MLHYKQVCSIKNAGIYTNSKHGPFNKDIEELCSPKGLEIRKDNFKKRFLGNKMGAMFNAANIKFRFMKGDNAEEPNTAAALEAETKPKSPKPKLE